MGQMAKYLWLLVLTAGSVSLAAQDVSRMMRKDSSSNFWKGILVGPPFALQGNFGVNLRSYSAFDVNNRQTPFTTTIFANTTVQSYRITIPFSFIINNLDQVSHPFTKDYFSNYFTNQRDRLTRIGISPYYKWARVHLGHRYMNFSDYTLANHNFLGAGVELNPGRLRFSAMAGRLSKAEPQNLALNRPNLPVYERQGWGFKIGYGRGIDYIDAIVFKAKDDPASIALQRDSNSVVLPGENLILGIKGQKQLFKGLNLEFEGARSAITRNVEDDRAAEKPFFLYNTGIFRQRTSTTFSNAVSAGLRYQIKTYRVGFGYQRIDPRYRSFGAYFFNEDFENLTLHFSGAFKRSLSVYAQGGLQRNNLDNSKPAAFRRLIGNLNLQYNRQTWNFGLNYSNFSSKVDYVLDPGADSLDVVLVSSEATANISKTIAKKGGMSQVYMLTGGVQTVNPNIKTPAGGEMTAMYFGNFAWSLHSPTRWQYNISFDYNRNALGGIVQNRFGLGGRIGKGLLDNKLDASIGSQLYRTDAEEGVMGATLLNHYLRLQWRINRRQNLQTQWSFVQNKRETEAETRRFSELIGTVGYNMQFGYHPFKTKTPAPSTYKNKNKTSGNK